MKTLKNVVLSAVLLSVFFACKNQTKTEQKEEKNWTNLIDKDLSNWDTYLSFQHQVGYDGTAPKDEEGNLIQPIGLNKTGYDVFTTIEEDEQPIIKVSGEYYGCIITKEEYSNYHFQLKFKWGEKKWVPRLDKLKDSGVLYHSIGPMGAEYWRSWMLSQEFQIMEGHTGDFWSQATSAIDIRAYNQESGMNLMAHESQDFVSVGDNELNKNYCLRSNNNENAHGEWNTLDLICFEGKSLHIVNGEVVMILKNSRYLNEKGENIPLTSGKIQLQSEAAELFYKDIKIRPLEKLSNEFTAYF
ncbi:DUF1080 domain-containing protein [Maribacter sp. 2308TA10-17]|uniref:3-keto-disaccharide hydrolase n=1 Tax=Maribacter sp. 2308TA10-17 TaxID=3386276 RepID=UPI0039BC886B